jgi:plastocyanin
MSVRVPLTFGAILTLALAAACGGGAGPTATPATATATPAAATATPVAATATPAAVICHATGEGEAVAIEGFSYNPGSTTAAVNGFITWTNNDDTSHTVTFDSGPNCGSLSGGDSETVQFTVAGTYAYHCNIHPEMTGTVEVS